MAQNPLDAVCISYGPMMYDPMIFIMSFADSEPDVGIIMFSCCSSGSPTALGIIYLCLARMVGLQAEGVSLPSHFLVRVSLDGQGALATEGSCVQQLASCAVMHIPPCLNTHHKTVIPFVLQFDRLIWHVCNACCS